MHSNIPVYVKLPTDQGQASARPTEDEERQLEEAAASVLVTKDALKLAQGTK